MIKTPLNQLLSNQYLIFLFIKEKLEIVSFIRWGYDNDLPILVNNKFLHSVAHIYYRSAIVEMCTLFDDHRHQSNNFHLLIRSDKRFIKELKPEAINLINLRLKEASIHFTNEIRDIRNEEISHFRFKERTVISLNNNYLIELNNLIKIAEDIIHLASQGQLDDSLNTMYITNRSSGVLYSLQKLLKDTNNFDYNGIWKNDYSTDDI